MFLYGLNDYFDDIESHFNHLIFRTSMAAGKVASPEIKCYTIGEMYVKTLVVLL